MREMEFRQLKPGDFVYSSTPEDLWTVVCPFPRHDTILLIQGRYLIARWVKWFWSLVVRFPDTTCLAVADTLDIRVARIIDPQKWTKRVL